MLRLENYDVEPLHHGSPVSSPKFSPDGSLILFVRSIVDVEKDSYESHVWVVPSSGGDARQLTYCDGSDTLPMWSPDGGTIYFSSDRALGDVKRSRLWAMPTAGGEARPILEGSVKDPRFSPDGARLLYLCRVEEPTETPEEQVEDVMWITKLRYKMDGQGYYPYTRTHVFIADLKNGTSEQLTSGPYDVASPIWAPDGKGIAYVANPKDGDYSRVRDIYVLPLGGEHRKMTKSDSIINSVAWSPDGEQLLYTGRKPEDTVHPPYMNTDIWVMPVGGGEGVNLTEDFDRTVGAYGSSIDWVHPDRVFFIAPNHGSYHIFRLDMATGDVKQVTEGNMTVSSFDMNRDATVFVFDASDACWPSEVYIYDGSGQRRLTNLNSEMMERWAISPPEEFWFTASDGVKVQGWIVKPHSYRSSVKYPMILEIHGGPHGAYGFKLGTAEHEFQLLAKNGYAVVYTNPRDSVGYGEEFAGVAEGAWGRRDFDDLMEAVDYVLENYDYIDGERLGVAGGSFGGFMTNWTVGHTDRFKAAVTMRSVCNWYSQVGYSDVSWGYSGIGQYREPWEVPEKYLIHSPISYAERMTTPLLIIHSEFDHRCPLPEGEQLYYTLKRLKRDVEYIRFANNSHGLSRIGKPSHRTQRLRHILRWFDRYL
jgi:dipeptidyl aminopeptidase/acylaminoacyl peptidase